MTQNHYQVSISEMLLQDSWSGGFRTGRPRRFGVILGRKTKTTTGRGDSWCTLSRKLPFFRRKSQRYRGPGVQSGQSDVFYRVDWGP